jgi:hypothetical protein
MEASQPNLAQMLGGAGIVGLLCSERRGAATCLGDSPILLTT